MDIKKEMEKMELSTARGRRTADGREIDISKDPSQVTREAEERRNAYLWVISRLKKTVGNNSYGIEEDELEAVEFLLEQLERLTRYTNEQVLEYTGDGDKNCY